MTHTNRLIKKVGVLTLPTPARLDAPLHVKATGSEDPEAYSFSPAYPELPEQLIPGRVS